MTNNKTTIQGSGIICKGDLKGGEFEMFPIMLFDYVQLDLINHADITVYMKLLQLYNHNEGYAYPTISQLMVYTRIRGKATINRSIKALEQVGLIKKIKRNSGNNVYIVYKPLSRDKLYSIVPDKVKQFKEFESKLLKLAEHDKERLQQHKIEKLLQDEEDNQIYARQIVLKSDYSYQ